MGTVCNWDWAGECGVRLVLADQPSAETTDRLLSLKAHLAAALTSGLVDQVVGYTTLTVFFDPSLVSRDSLVSLADQWSGNDQEQGCASQLAPRQITLPVWYAPEAGADLLSVATELGMTPAELIAIHSERDYRAYANGFAPGFCYLGQTSEAIARPRLRTPRRAVPPGSVAIADRQTAVYPSSSPGGWRLLGRCPLPMFDIARDPPNRLQVGDTVRFQPISKTEFIALGGLV